jgi:hypothetical protein
VDLPPQAFNGQPIGSLLFDGTDAPQHASNRRESVVDHDLGTVDEA